MFLFYVSTKLFQKKGALFREILYLDSRYVRRTLLVSLIDDYVHSMYVYSFSRFFPAFLGLLFITEIALDFFLLLYAYQRQLSIRDTRVPTTFIQCGHKRCPQRVFTYVFFPLEEGFSNAITDISTHNFSTPDFSTPDFSTMISSTKNVQKVLFNFLGLKISRNHYDQDALTQNFSTLS